MRIDLFSPFWLEGFVQQLYSSPSNSYAVKELYKRGGSYFNVGPSTQARTHSLPQEQINFTRVLQYVG